MDETRDTNRLVPAPRSRSARNRSRGRPFPPTTGSAVQSAFGNWYAACCETAATRGKSGVARSFRRTAALAGTSRDHSCAGAGRVRAVAPRAGLVRAADRPVRSTGPCIILARARWRRSTVEPWLSRLEAECSAPGDASCRPARFRWRPLKLRCGRPPGRLPAQRAGSVAAVERP
jgi:hypothetical protein